MTDDANEKASEKTKILLASVWQRNLPLVHQRLEILRSAAAAALSHGLTKTIAEEAAATAHKLAGSLGMFGFHEGTRIAREIEEMLESGAEPDPGILADRVESLSRTFPT